MEVAREQCSMIKFPCLERVGNSSSTHTSTIKTEEGSDLNSVERSSCTGWKKMEAAKEQCNMIKSPCLEREGNSSSTHTSTIKTEERSDLSSVEKSSCTEWKKMEVAREQCNMIKFPYLERGGNSSSTNTSTIKTEEGLDLSSVERSSCTERETMKVTREQCNLIKFPCLERSGNSSSTHASTIKKWKEFSFLSHLW